MDYGNNKLENKQKLLVFFSFCVYLIFDTCTLLEPPFTEGIKITLEIYNINIIIYDGVQEIYLTVITHIIMYN